MAELDPSRAVILDYTSESEDEINFFANWGIQGHFPGPFGHLPRLRAQQRYPRRLPADSSSGFLWRPGMRAVRGMIFWPELSHSDTFMLDYFTANAWRPLEKTPRSN